MFFNTKSGLQCCTELTAELSMVRLYRGTGVCTTEYHTIFYHSYFMLLLVFWKGFPCSFSSCGLLRLDLAYSSSFEAVHVLQRKPPSMI